MVRAAAVFVVGFVCLLVPTADGASDNAHKLAGPLRHRLGHVQLGTQTKTYPLGYLRLNAFISTGRRIADAMRIYKNTSFSLRHLCFAVSVSAAHRQPQSPGESSASAVTSSACRSAPSLNVRGRTIYGELCTFGGLLLAAGVVFVSSAVFESQALARRMAQLSPSSSSTSAFT